LQKRKQYVLTEQTLRGLLALFDADSRRASERYELMRAGLDRFFQQRGVSCAADLADRTIDIVAQRIAEGEPISQNKLTAYFYGTARNVYREYLRGMEGKSIALEDLSVSDQPMDRQTWLDPVKEERMTLEVRLSCLDKCLELLPPEQKGLILSYYEGKYGDKIENRHELARILGLSQGALRIRTHRIREDLEECLASCLKSALH
jgi:RNA polymerase sigma factor (sigma-70 family)